MYYLVSDIYEIDFLFHINRSDLFCFIMCQPVMNTQQELVCYVPTAMSFLQYA